MKAVVAAVIRAVFRVMPTSVSMAIARLFPVFFFFVPKDR